MIFDCGPGCSRSAFGSPEARGLMDVDRVGGVLRRSGKTNPSSFINSTSSLLPRRQTGQDWSVGGPLPRETFRSPWERRELAAERGHVMFSGESCDCKIPQTNSERLGYVSVSGRRANLRDVFSGRWFTSVDEATEAKRGQKCVKIMRKLL